jgi:molecular chaperone DnaK (HSP70)
MLFTADFNRDSKPDIVSVEGAATQSGSLSGLAPESTADVLLNTSQGTSGGSQLLTVTLAPSANPVATGSPVQLTATVSAAAGAPAPSGNVAFFDGSTMLGTAPVNAGVATLSVATLPIGVQSLTASYSGDANFGAVTSAAVSETVLATTARVPLLTASIPFSSSSPTCSCRATRGRRR